MSISYFHWIHKIRNQFSKLVAPISRREDEARKEYILNVFLVFLAALSTIFFISVVSLAYLLRTSRNGISVISASSMMIILIVLLILSKKGYRKLASWLFLSMFIGPTLYSIFRWGTLLPIPLLALSLIIIMTSILINTRTGIIIALGLGSYLGIIMYADRSGLIHIDTSWYDDIVHANYIVELAVLLLIIAGVTWLAYREIESSLKRARRSEAEVKRERDKLEERVEERTQQLKREQMQHMANMVRFAEIGKLSAGFFHDLINPLTAVKLHIGELQRAEPTIAEEIRGRINQAVSATNRLADFTTKIRRELSTGGNKSLANIATEIEQAIDVVEHQAHRYGVTVSSKIETNIHHWCNPLKFHRAVVNLLINAIEACGDNPDNTLRIVDISLAINNGKANLVVTDTGSGISAEHLPYIFQPFFTTKTGQGLGLGLSITKDILVEELNAQIKIDSEISVGTKIIISWTPSSN